MKGRGLKGPAYFVLSIVLLLILFISSSMYFVNGEFVGLPYMLAVIPELLLMAGCPQKKMHRMTRLGRYEMMGGAILVMLILPLFIDSIAELQYKNISFGGGDYRERAILGVVAILFGSMLAIVGALHYRYRKSLLHGNTKTDTVFEEGTRDRSDGGELLAHVARHAVPAIAVLITASFLAWLATPLVIRWDKILPYLTLLMIGVVFIILYRHGTKKKTN